MRITNRMMTTNALNNINRNKINLSNRENQYETGQKIQRPSEDPVVAVRSLKYRTQLTELSQYVDKNIADAFSWMDVTEKAMKSVQDMLPYLNGYCEQGANDTLETYERDSIIATLQQYKEHIADMNNTDYAGRYVFTGYRTDVPMLFPLEETNYSYTIKENFSFTDITATSYVKGGARYDHASATGVGNNTANNFASQAPTMQTAQKIKLTYENTSALAGDEPTITFRDAKGDIVGTPVTAVLKPLAGSTTGGDCYEAGDNEILYIPETGELIFGKDAYTAAQDPQVASIEVTYQKKEFAKGDIRPEHYFECDAKNNATGQTINYTNPAVQKIQYEVNFSQMFTVNTLGKDAFPTSVGSKIDELIRNVNEVFDMDTKLAEVEKMIGDETDPAKLEALNELKAQLNTEKTLKKDVLRRTFASALTTVKRAEEKVSIAMSNHGSRYLRLELTDARLKSQKTDFKDMLYNNDSVDVEDAVVNYNSAELTYNASLYCAANVVRNTLLDFLR